ncbi:DNA polymerase III, delta' subunit domain protein [Synechococcus sp. PCC 7335]|uniref:DNA polymerase III subunit delta' n=1 Tax=Synechococcus sp. (strain ATCC 29403 / PCC 7335) TaxID=91464 RepID=UPI00017ECE17|nr:DNA polymerase III subunit delta' [Synechococcus sp. PCC 7335]EDX87539.1 DNA polymerase III, delta' subunit domain protein [Synechococcus sp. PCC 7335]
MGNFAIDMIVDKSVDPFASLIGQEQAITLLRRVVQLQRVAPGYLFVGPTGTGKSLAATGFAQLLLSSRLGQSASATAILARRIRDRNHPDLLWIEPTYLHQGKLLTAAEAAEAGLKRKSPPRIRLPQIRRIARFLSRPPLESDRAVVIIEQAEKMAEGAANALLKTLEEPGQATLVLLAPDQQALLSTLVSRCQSIPFRRLNNEQMVQVLTQTGSEEIVQSMEIMAIAQGSPGQAIDSWQQMQALPSELLASLEKPPVRIQTALEIAKEINQTLDTEAQLWLLDYLQHRYWQQGQSEIEELEALEKAREYLLAYVQPRLVWEVTLSTLTKNRMFSL